MGKLITIGQILDTAFEHYTRHFKVFMQVSFWLFAVSIFAVVGVILQPAYEMDYLIEYSLLSGSEYAGLIISLIGVVVLAPIIGVWITVALIQIEDNIIKNKAAKFKSIAVDSWKKFFSYVWIAILKAVILLIPALAVVPGFALVALNIYVDGGVWLGAVSLILLVLGAIAGLILIATLSVLLAFPAFALVSDNVRGVSALKESKKLIQGRFWSVLWRLFVPKMIFTAGLIVVQIILLVIIYPLLGFSSLDAEALYKISSILDNITSIGLSALVAPLYIIADYLIYDSLRKTYKKH